MSPPRSPKLRAVLRRTWDSDAVAPLRFYAPYFHWPLILALVALAGEKAVYYGALPLAGVAGREWAYFQAERDFRAGRDADALYQIRQALLNTRDNPRLWRLAAQISSAIDSPEAAYCWQQVDRLAPGVPETQLALADAALQQGDAELAATALREVATERQGSCGYLIAAGRLARAESDNERADYFFTQAEALRPADGPALLALADWHLARHDWTQARAILIGLTARPGTSLAARRKLVDLDGQRGDLAAGRVDAAQLAAQPGASFSDRVRQLDFSARPAPLLPGLLRCASPSEAARVLVWMTQHGRAEEALIWIRRRDESWQEQPDIGLARAGCLEALGEWEHLRDDQRDSRWPGREPARLHVLARASLALGLTDDARAAWKSAVAACSTPADFAALVEAAGVFPDADEARAEVWRAMSDRYPGQQWPLRSLLRYDLQSGDLVAAQNVAARLAAVLPGNAAIGATRDLLCLLRGVEVPQVEADLVVLRARQSDDPTVATAAAYSLYQQGRLGDALAAIGVLDPTELRAPERAPYLGQLLAAAGPPAQAESVLELALAQPHLLEPQRRDIERALDLATGRRVLADLLHPPNEAARARAAAFFAAQAGTGQAVSLIGASVAEGADRARAAADLARIDPLSLDRPELVLEEGAVLALSGRTREAGPWLMLSPDLPVESTAALWHRVVEGWWQAEGAAPFDPSVTVGLLGAYRGLEAAEPDAAFWQRDESRELALTRAALLAGLAPDAVQTRLEALLHHVPATPEIEAQVGDALFLQGRVEAGRQRLEILSPAELAQPEPARYYAAILRASGETRKAHAYLLLATRSGLPRPP